MSTIICLNFKEGNCLNGDTCKYSHDLNANKKTSKTPCKYFQEGKCKNGDNCMFSHL